MKKHWLSLVLVCSIAWSNPVSAQIAMPAFVVGSGATQTSNSELQMVGTFGQAIVGLVGNNSQTHTAGFWGPLVSSTSTGVERMDDREIPQQYRLDGNYPNPFNPTTTIRFQLPEEAVVRLTVYDMLGRTVAILVDEVLREGRYRLTWDARDRMGRSVASGSYLYRLEAPAYSHVRIMTLLK